MRRRRFRFWALACLGLAVILFVFILYSRRGAGTSEPRSQKNPAALLPAPGTSASDKPLSANREQVRTEGDAELIQEKVRNAISQITKACAEAGDIQEAAFVSMDAVEALKVAGGKATLLLLAKIEDAGTSKCLRTLLMDIVSQMQTEPAVAEALLRVLSDTTQDSFVRMKAVDFLYRVNTNSDTGVQLLKSLKTERDLQVRFALVRAFAHYKVPEVTPILKEEFNRGDYLMQVVAAHSLASQDTPETVQFLQQYAETSIVGSSTKASSKDEVVLMHVVTALGIARDSSSVPILTHILLSQGQTPDVRKMAAESLGNLGGQEAYRFLVKALRTETDEAVLVYIGDALARTGYSGAADECRKVAGTVQDDYVRRSLLVAAGAIEKEQSQKTNDVKPSSGGQ